MTSGVPTLQCVRSAALAALTAAACASPPPPEPQDPTTAPALVLAQTLPLGGRAAYAIVDSVRVVADGQRVRFSTEATYEAELRLRFRTRGDSLEVIVTPTAFAGRIDNPTTGAVTASMSDIRGEWTASVARDGSVQVLEAPALTDGFRAVVGTEDLVRALFVPLPDGPAEVGTVWVDTLFAEDVGAWTSQSSRSIVRSRVSDRTRVAGRTVLVVDAVIDLTLEATSASPTDEPSTQVLRGSLRSRSSWDAGLRRLADSRTSGRLTGELRVEGLEPVPLTADIVRAVVAR